MATTKLMKVNGQYTLYRPELPLSAELDLDEGVTLPVDITILDGRKLSDKQRKFIFALVNAYGYETGLDREEFRAVIMQTAYDVKLANSTSLRDYTMTEGNNLITLIISVLIDKNIPISGQLISDNEYHFSEQQMYMLCLKRSCCICGRRAELHHVDAVGMRNRNKISHIGMRMLPLCREHHTQCHGVGNKTFIERHHLTPCVVDENLEKFIKRGSIRVHAQEDNDEQ